MNARTLKIGKRLFSYTPKIQFGKAHEAIARPYESKINERGQIKRSGNPWELTSQPQRINTTRGRTTIEFSDDDMDFFVGDSWFLEHEKVGSLKL